MKHLVIIGAGNFGREMFWHTKESVGYNTEFDVKGFIDDQYDSNEEKYKRLPFTYLGKITDYKIEKDDVFISAVGDGRGREAVVKVILDKGGEFINIINRTSIVQGQVSLGKGVFIGPYTVIGDNVTIGNHVMLNTHSSIGHDAEVGDYVSVMSYVDITGWCKIGERVFLGSGCRMTPKTDIGNDAYVGIGSVVLRKVKPNTKVFGNPAKKVDI